MAAASPKTALVVGGGFAGLAAAQVLTEKGLDVVLVEQGRGLGGRMCTRTATVPGTGERLTFDHGCQYLTARSPQWDAALERLRAAGAVAAWETGGRVGTATLNADDSLDEGSFSADKGKELLVGCPTNSAVGRALAAAAGPRLTTITGTRVGALSWDGKAWRVKASRPPVLSLRVTPGGRGGSGSGEGDTSPISSVDEKERQREEAMASLESRAFDMTVTAMSSVSTAKLLGDGGHGGVPLAADVAVAAGAVRSNVCWALMVALKRKLDLPFDGALLSRPDPAGGPLPLYGPVAWLSRDCTKPGRPAVAGGAGETWVVHGGPGWSNDRAAAAPEAVARELLEELARLAQTELVPERDVLHMEAHRWNNAYPLNPRPPVPPPPGSPAAELGLGLGGCYMLRADLALVACGDWAKGPRGGDAYVSGWEAAHALLASV
ncbi:hypothetical protein HYH02_010326 [Chlamydomonas schloesseri]|uniref:Amine oxidase domain-containing protein n=1 Tax=Chlamydomonas schloesseri TaxID=2026947 RepID=A0A835W7P3_9CHLO|nr:hypothetical protein HYH02_010326 [Chlamydomonas schloesseri]|eukprot:KAG2440443.1 hypothetical protein HYH02_010326 [Chlamydomonas schloesseri]